MIPPFAHIGVLGAGAWGAALAQTCARAGRTVTLWARDTDQAARMAKTRFCPRLPGVVLEPSIAPTGDPAALKHCDAVLMVIPAQAARGALEALSPFLPDGAPLVSCSKGYERGSLAPMSVVMRDMVPQARRAVLSGPSFAGEVARGLPAAVTLAAEDLALAEKLALSIGWTGFRPYLSTDIAGAELGGAMKNVLAIACGAAQGMELGASAHAGLITRGFAEMTRLGEALGARRETLQGLSGLGDLVLTCSSPQSRNMALGLALGKGKTVAELTGDGAALAEGAATAPALLALARRLGVEAPICEAVAGVLAGDFTTQEAMHALLARAMKVETG